MASPKVDPTLNLPETKAARFRLYDVVSPNRLRNREGVNFTCDSNDYFLIGDFKQTMYINRTELTARLKALDNFFWIRFRKQDDSIREMYALKMNEKIAGNLSLKDLSLPNREHRQCVVSRIIDFVSEGTHFIVGRRPPTKRTTTKRDAAPKGGPAKKKRRQS